MLSILCLANLRGPVSTCLDKHPGELPTSSTLLETSQSRLKVLLVLEAVVIAALLAWLVEEFGANPGMRVWIAGNFPMFSLVLNRIFVSVLGIIIAVASAYLVLENRFNRVLTTVGDGTVAETTESTAFSLTGPAIVVFFAIGIGLLTSSWLGAAGGFFLGLALLLLRGSKM